MEKMRALLPKLLVVSLVGIGLALMPQTASAAPLVYEVDESVVPGTDPLFPDFLDQVVNLTSTYVETVSLSGSNFTANLLVTFNNYQFPEGTDLPSQIGTNTAAGEIADPNEYGLYALVTVTGSFTSGACLGDPANTCFDFDPMTSTAQVFISPDQQNDPQGDCVANPLTADCLILTASMINPLLSDGDVEVLTATGQVLNGDFSLVYTNAATQGLGITYWPDFTGLVLTATATGDVNTTSIIVPGVGGDVRGEANIIFEGAQVPEPASLTLLAMGLLGAAISARRRRVN